MLFKHANNGAGDGQGWQSRAKDLESEKEVLVAEMSALMSRLEEADTRLDEVEAMARSQVVKAISIVKILVFPKLPLELLQRHRFVNILRG